MRIPTDIKQVSMDLQGSPYNDLRRIEVSTIAKTLGAGGGGV